MQKSNQPQSVPLNPNSTASIVHPPSHNIKVEIVTDLDALTRYQPAWDRLALVAPRPLPMSSAAWIIPYVKYRLHEKERWAVALAFDGSELVGVLPLLICPHRVLGINTVKLRTMFGPHTYSVELLADSSRELAVVAAILAALGKVDRRWHHLDMRRLSSTSPLFNYLGEQGRSLRQYHEECDSGSFLATVGDFNAFYKTLSRNTRRALTKAHHKLDQYSDVKCIFLSGDDSTEERFQDFLKVDAASWRGEAGCALDSDPVVLNFYREAIQRLAKLGWLEWHFMTIEGRAVAAQLAFRMGRRLIIKRISHDESCSSFAPGNILFEHTVRRAFEADDIDEIDCLTDMPWHDKWRCEKHSHHHLWIYAPGFFPLVTGYLPARAKTMLRRIPGLVSAFHFVGMLARRLRGRPD